MGTALVANKKNIYQNNNSAASFFGYIGLFTSAAAIIVGLIYAILNAYPDIDNEAIGTDWMYLWYHYFCYFGVQVSYISLAFFLLFFFNKTFGLMKTGSFQNAMATFAFMTMVIYFLFEFRENLDGRFSDGSQIIPAEVTGPETTTIMMLFWISTAIINLALPVVILFFFIAQILGKRSYSFNKSMNHFAFTMVYPVIYILFVSLYPFFLSGETIYGPNSDASASMTSYFYILAVTGAFIISTICFYTLDANIRPLNKKIDII